MFIPLFGRAIFYTTAPTILLQHCGSSQSSGRKIHTKHNKYKQKRTKDIKKRLIAECGTNLSETCENFQHVFNIHICSTSYGKGDNLSKSVKHRIILTFSLFSIPHLIIETILFIQTITPSRFNLESLLNKPS